MQLVKNQSATFLFRIEPGYIVLHEFSILGGTEAVQQRSDDGRKVLTEVKIDNIDLFKTAKSIDSSARFQVRTFCAHTVFGDYTDNEGWDLLSQKINELSKEATEFNKLAKSMGSDRRVIIKIYRLPLSADNDPIRERLQLHVLEELKEFKETMLTGKYVNVDNFVKLRIGNLHLFCGGVHKDVLKEAVLSYKDQRKLLLHKEDPKKLDYRMIDDAIALFAEGIE